jgi:pimeloyl-ACP methyl ester carboxylesterase
MTKIFIIHGWTYTLDKWTELCNILRSYDIEVVQLKVPGLTAKSNKAWNIDDYITWLHEQLQGETKPIVIGHSNGGRIALNYASRYPSALGKLILIGSAGVYHGDLLSKTKRGVFKAAAKVGKPLARVPIAKKVFYRVIGAKDYYKASEHMKETMRNMLVADHKLNLKNIQIPVQLIWGGQDNATPLSDAHKLQQELHQASLEIINGAGHSPHASHPNHVADIITKTIQEGNT